MNAAERAELERFMRARAAEIHAGRRRGVGDAGGDLRAMPLPGPLERYLATGAPMPAWKRDLGAMSAQVPRYVYGIGAVLAIIFASRAYKRWRDAK